MRGSIGTITLFNFVSFFILLVVAFLLGTLSYFKAFKVNNYIVSSIEKYEGFNEVAHTEIYNKLRSVGYVVDEVKCPSERGDSTLMTETDGTSKLAYTGFCVYKLNNYNEYVNGEKKLHTDEYNRYEVLTRIQINLPGVANALNIRVAARTKNIYDYEQSYNNLVAAKAAKSS